MPKQQKRKKSARPDLLPPTLSGELSYVLKRRLWSLSQFLPDNDRTVFLRRVPTHLAMRSAAAEAGPSFEELHAVNRALARVFELYPLAAALSATVEEADPFRPAHDRLLAWVTYASLSLLQKNLKYKDAIERALADCRLLGQRQSERALLVCVGEDIAGAQELIQALIRMKQEPGADMISDRHADAVRVVVEYFQADIPPIARPRGAAVTRHYISRTVVVRSIEVQDDDGPEIEEVVTAVIDVPVADWREDDTGEASTLVRVKPSGNSKERRIAAIQRSRARGYVNALAIRGHRLPSSWDHATPHEIREAIRISQPKMAPGSCQNWQDYLGVILVLVLGRPPDVLKSIFSMTEGPNEHGHLLEGDEGRWAYEFDLDIPPRTDTGPDEKKILRGNGADKVRLLLPVFLTPSLRALSYPLDERVPMPNPVSVISELAGNLARPASLVRLSRVLRDRLEAKVSDSSVAGLIVGLSVKNLASLYYTAHKLSDLQSAFDEIISELFETEHIPQLVSVQEVGTPNRYRHSAVRALYKLNQDTIASARTAIWPIQIKFHNHYTLYTYLLLTLATGHRPVRNPFESIKDFDLRRNVVYVGDKDNKAGPNFRIVPLAPIAVRQVEAWKRHLLFISENWCLTQQAVAKAAQRALNGEGGASSFLFFIDLDNAASGVVQTYRPTPLAPGDVQIRLEKIWPAKDNWGRHHMRTELARKLPDELLDAFMGHTPIGGEPLIRESGLALEDFSILRNAVEDVLKDMLVGAVDGFG